MKKIINLEINELSENDMRNIFHDAISELGIPSGLIIPDNMVKLREKLLK